MEEDGTSSVTTACHRCGASQDASAEECAVSAFVERAGVEDRQFAVARVYARSLLDLAVQAGATEEAVVDFSDGSEVRVRGSSQLRVLGVTPEGAQVSLERGAAPRGHVHAPALVVQHRGHHLHDGRLVAIAPVGISVASTGV